MATKNEMNIDDKILETEVSIKLTLRHLLQIAVMAEMAKSPENQCEAVYGRIVERLHRLPEKTKDRFVEFQDKVFAFVGPEWPDEIN